MLLGAISQRFDTIVEFIAFEDFVSFERKARIRLNELKIIKLK